MSHESNVSVLKERKEERRPIEKKEEVEDGSVRDRIIDIPDASLYIRMCHLWMYGIAHIHFIVSAFQKRRIRKENEIFGTFFLTSKSCTFCAY